MPYGPREAADAIRHAGARAVFALAAAGERRPAEELVRLRPDLPSLAHVVAVGGEVPDGALAFDDVARPGVALPPPPAARDPYVMLFTSGTSSSPKAVLTDYRRFLANARLNCSEKQMGPGSIMLSAAPFTHLFGLYSFHLTLYGGGATALLPAFSPPGLVEAIRRSRPSHIFAAPAHIASCLEAGLLDGETLAPVHYCVVSGAKAAPAFYQKGAGGLRERPRRAALGHDGVPVRHVHPALRVDRTGCMGLWTSEPGERGPGVRRRGRTSPGGRGRRTPDPRRIRVRRLSSGTTTPTRRRSPTTAGSGPATGR